MLNEDKRKRQRTAAAVLTEQEVARVKRNILRGMSLRELAQAYGVALDTIRRIARGDSWSWVEAEGEMPKADHSPVPAKMQAEAARSFERLQAMLKGQGGEVEALPVEAPPTAENILTRLTQDIAQAREAKAAPDRMLEELGRVNKT